MGVKVGRATTLKTGEACPRLPGDWEVEGYSVCYRSYTAYWGSRGWLATLVIGAYVLFSGNFDLLTGIDKLAEQPGTSQSGLVVQSPEERELVDFVSVVLADTEETWHGLLQQQKVTYQEPTLVLYRDAVDSACGLGQAAMGPFYCPVDHKLYIDLSFYSELKQRYRAPGDFAQAYVFAPRFRTGSSSRSAGRPTRTPIRIVSTLSPASVPTSGYLAAMIAAFALAVLDPTGSRADLLDDHHAFTLAHGGSRPRDAYAELFRAPFDLVHARIVRDEPCPVCGYVSNRGGES